MCFVEEKNSWIQRVAAAVAAAAAAAAAAVRLAFFKEKRLRKYEYFENHFSVMYI